MQHFLPYGLAKFVSPLVVTINKSFRTLLLASGLLLVFSMQANAQDDWTPVATIDGVEISYMKSKCNYSEVYFFKAVNTSNSSVALDLSFKITLDETQSASGELGSLELPGSGELVSSCDGGLMINIFDHFTVLDQSYSLEITKSE